MMLQQIADKILKAAGGKVTIHEQYSDDQGALEWVYNCPCGELSYITLAFPRDMLLVADAFGEKFAEYEAEVALEAMRLHVRGEGNTPSF